MKYKLQSVLDENMNILIKYKLNSILEYASNLSDEELKKLKHI